MLLAKAPEDWRTPRRWREALRPQFREAFGVRRVYRRFPFANRAHTQSIAAPYFHRTPKSGAEVTALQALARLPSALTKV
jgi:hypothetical protein